MGKLLKILGVLFLLLVGAFVGVYFWAKSATEDTQELANRFVTHLSKQELDAAYALLHHNVQEKFTPDAFEVLVENGRLTTLQPVEWHGFFVEDDVDRIEGSTTTTEGVPIVAEIKATEIENGGKLGILGFDFSQR